MMRENPDQTSGISGEDWCVCTEDVQTHPMALRFFKEGQPTCYESMGNGFYAGSDFIKLGVKAGLLESAIRKRMIKLLNNIRKQGADVIESSFMNPRQQKQYRDLMEQRMRFLSLLDIP